MVRQDAIAVCDLGASGGRIFAATFDRGKLSLEEIHRFTHTPLTLWQYQTNTLQLQTH